MVQIGDVVVDKRVEGWRREGGATLDRKEVYLLVLSPHAPIKVSASVLFTVSTSIL